ncbi:hypothetical protein [Paenisporosarcina antarctica]|nr:hypothetical protein [Paenisporosarcina antarctica]
MNNNDPLKNTAFDGVKFVNGLLLVIFISLLLFGSRDVPVPIVRPSLL